MDVAPKLTSKVFNRWAFSSKSSREDLHFNYFAFTNDFDVNIPFLDTMLENHRKCPYWKLLKHYCPCSVDTGVKKDRRNRLKFPKPPLKTLLADHCTIKSVHSFVCSVLKKIIPLEMFGNMDNRKTFFSNIQGILCVQKYGTISLCQLISEIKISKMSWLSHLNHPEQRVCFLKCVDFLVTKVICPLLQSFFIVVESSYAKLKLFMFRKRVWHRLRQKAFVDFKKFCRLSIISQNKFYDLIKKGDCLGCSTINFILKKTSLRPISNVSFCEKGKLSINAKLITLLTVLNFEKENKSSFGATAMGTQDFHQKYREYIIKRKRDDCKRLYFVTADVEKCFDSINTSLLLKIALKLFKSDVYSIKKYRRHFRNKKTSIYFESVHDLKYVQHRYGDVELMDQRTVSKITLEKTLEALLQKNVVKMGKNYYLQNKGISQGSKVSSILCAVYLSHVEKEINTTKGKDDFFVRMEDEYLFISTMKSSAKSFLRNLIVRMPEFECNINMSKCGASFDCDLDPDIGFIPQSSKIKFFGLFLDSVNFSVSSDYSRYKGLKTSDVVSCKLDKSPGRRLRDTVVKSLYPKCYTILFDTTINSQKVIERNVLEIFCMSAVKFHFLVMSLPEKNRVIKNPLFFLEIILSLPAILCEHISHLLDKVVSSKEKLNFSLTIGTVSGLCHNAFLYKLQENKSTYCYIIEELKEKGSRYPMISESFAIEAFNNIFLK